MASPTLQSVACRETALKLIVVSPSGSIRGDDRVVSHGIVEILQIDDDQREFDVCQCDRHARCIPPP